MIAVAAAFGTALGAPQAPAGRSFAFWGRPAPATCPTRETLSDGVAGVQLAARPAGAPRPGGAAEGVATGRAACQLARRLGVDPPVATAVADAPDGSTTLEGAVEALLSRRLKEEPMLFAVFCDDKRGSIEVRKANRDAHLAYLQSSGVVVQAGPFLDAEGLMCGSLIILDVADHTAAEAWAAGDPYARAGLFERVEVRAWSRVVG